VDKLHQFYCSKSWRDLAYSLKIKANGKCNRCGNVQLDFSKLIGHHTIELNEDNINSPSIALNPDKIEIICHSCHDKQHRRFGNKQNVYIVYGSPLSGKTTLVRELMQHGDMVLDMDAIWQAITLQDEYVKPSNVRFNIFALRDNLLDQVKRRYGNWYDCYIVGGYPDKYERERLAQSLGAEVIYCESTKEECIDRLDKSNKPGQWLEYINDWWDKYE